MKKIYFFLSAACVATSAYAVQKDMLTQQTLPMKAETVQAVKAAAGEEIAKAVFAPEAAAKKATRAGGTTQVYVFPASNVMSISPNVAGRMYPGIGFASSYGTVDFLNYSTGFSAFEWTYSDLDDYVREGDNTIWNEKTANTPDLSIKSGVGYFKAPYVMATPDDGGAKVLGETFLNYVYCGGGADYWVNPRDVEEDDQFGVTFYQNTGLLNGKSNGNTCGPNAYRPNSAGFDANGVYTQGNSAWKKTLESAWFNGQTVTDIKFNNFTVVQPKPASTYMMTRGWIWMQVDVTAPTQLMSYIYPIDEEGFITDMPIAVGYASIPKEGTDTPVFYYVPLNEDGDEIEDVVYIDSAVAITIEGFAGNDAIKQVAPVCGFYPFNYNDYFVVGNHDVCKPADLYLNFDVTAGGQLYDNCLVYNLGLYGFGDDDDTLTSLSYAQYSMDATFAFIQSTDGKYTVDIPAAGGKVEKEIEALYYNIKVGLEEGMYVMEAPEWLTVEVSDPNPQTGTTMLTLSAAASEEGRTGVVSIEGVGATYSLTVNQGDVNAVTSVSIDKKAEYFDLQGRRVANPDKGIYIKKSGNKSEKVIL
ncbi:MAG: hypothetical protein K2N09_01440 [Muribaculaceae bacterium]|nr:hypothetical protein [Muribaculaceae bacterium]